ncbi:hypothetical protein MHZ92_21005 [Sporosarcina sp. ACRSL]|uniref:hypothetical protein n=1 Tax=Sporosarcina sp. ACRSL TaxID=2918215 RepID=UPI001EF4D8AF|nr:hypothetical protein [Sporosarcina sp. ACRSL]MCG7346584.1 hypothetical protein [Sporosarcina sp. ACRSL]
MKKVFLCNSLFFCVFFSTICVAYAEEGENGKGLLSGVFDNVESTVKETTESIGDVVDSAEEGADQTVQDTVSFTKATVETLVDPSSEQPVSDIVNHTVEFVDKTVDNVVPVIENATEAVQPTTSEVPEIVEELPVVPVVTPILDEVSNASKGTTKTVNPVEEADSFGTVSGNESSALLEKEVMPPTDLQQDEEIGRLAVTPNDDTYQDEPVEDLTSTIKTFKATEVNKETTFISNDASLETTVSPVNHSSVKIETPANPESPMIPIRAGEPVDRFPIVLTTNTTSIISPLVAYGGNADVVAGIVDSKAIRLNFSGRQWVHSDELMRIQWVHAPPGKPPQSNPFLQLKK